MTRFALTLLLALPLHAAAPESMPIAAARMQPQGTTVTVLGLVTVPSARFRSSADQGFAVQDQTGGIWISTQEDLGLAADRLVQVRGILGTSNGKLQIVPSSSADVRQLPGRELCIATGRVGAATAGFIITIEGTIDEIKADLPYGYKVFIDDGSGSVQVFLSASADFESKVRSLKAGQTIRVTGFSSQYDATFEVEPASPRDIRVIHAQPSSAKREL
jgi:DNA/RNA endonuclease YhcR with UshA esterase domain